MSPHEESLFTEVYPGRPSIVSRCRHHWGRCDIDTFANGRWQSVTVPYGLLGGKVTTFSQNCRIASTTVMKPS